MEDFMSGRNGGLYRIDQEVPVRFAYPVYFLEGLFTSGNSPFDALLASDGDSRPRPVLFVLDEGMLRHHAQLPEQISAAADRSGGAWRTAGRPIVIPGGERCKNDPAIVARILDGIHEEGLCRHSYVAAVGGGALLDVVGFAASTAHRGIRLLRVPTTVLAQNDSGIGVKNGVNAYGKKNFLGAFAPPYAIFNDFQFLDTLEDRDWRAGIAEAVKVALIKDPGFFSFLEDHAAALASRSTAPMQELVVRCAALHLEHIRTSGDPFEMGSSRPLDFGHWSAHKIEQLSGYAVRHGEAVAMGIALDCVYAYLSGLLSPDDLERILHLLESVGFDLFTPEMALTDAAPDGDMVLFDGLEEFREHLGGRLTLLLATGIGQTHEVHAVERSRYKKAISMLEQRSRHVTRA